MDLARSVCTSSPIPRDRLANALRAWGDQLVLFRLIVIPLVVVVLLVLAIAGLSIAELDEGSHSQWSPTGGAMERQIGYVETYFSTPLYKRQDAWIILRKQGGGNLLEDPRLYLQLFSRLVRQLRNTTFVHAQDALGNSIEIGWDDVCATLAHPIFDMLSAPPLPCLNPSALDPFREGGFQFEGDNTLMDQIQGLEDIFCAVAGRCGDLKDMRTSPSFEDLSSSEIIDFMSFNASHWLRAASIPLGEMFGGNSVDENGRLTHVETLNLWLPHLPPEDVVIQREKVAGLTPEQFHLADLNWLLELEKQAQIADGDDRMYPGVEVMVYPGNAMDRMYADVAASSTMNILVGYAIMLVYVVCSQATCHRSTNLAPIAFLGFVVVVLANSAAYGVIALAGVKYNHTMTQALPFLALGLGVDDLFLLLHHFSTQLSHAHEASGDSRMAVRETLAGGGASVTITSFCNAVAFFVGCIVPIPAIRTFLVAAGIIVLFNWLCALTLLPALFSFLADFVLTTERAKDGGCSGFATKAIHSVYDRASQSLIAKVCCLLFGLVILISTASQIPSVSMGYDNTDLAKDGTYLARGIDTMWGLVKSQFSSELLIGGPGIDYPVDQHQLLMTQQLLQNSSWSSTGFGQTRGAHWLQNMYDSPGVCRSDGWIQGSPCQGEHFYDAFQQWRERDTILPSGQLNLGSIVAMMSEIDSFGWSTNASDYSPNNTIMLSFSWVQLNMKVLDGRFMTAGEKTRAKIQMVKDYRQICKDSGLNVFMFGWLFTQMEQFLELEHYFWMTIATAMPAIFIVCLCMGLSLFGSCIVAVFSLALTVELYGCLALFGIQFQSLVAVSALMSLGIAVEFSAHPVAAYEFASGTRDKRVAEAMRHTAVPVLEGAFSSFLGFMMLYWSDFPYVRKYFFGVYLLIVVLGCINGLIVLPAVLGLFGSPRG